MKIVIQDTLHGDTMRYADATVMCDEEMVFVYQARAQCWRAFFYDRDNRNHGEPICYDWMDAAESLERILESRGLDPKDKSYKSIDTNGVIAYVDHPEYCMWH